MITETDLQMISHLRRNARQSGALLARTLGIPASTFFDKLRSCEKKFVRKHTSLLDFAKLGFLAKVQIVFSISDETKAAVQDFLMHHKNVNSFYRINRGFDYLVECVFSNHSEVKDFIDMLKRDFRVEKYCLFEILEDLQKEEFLSCQKSLKS